MRTPITFPQLEQKIRELVASNPDYEYPSSERCLYNQEGNIPPCIFGRAFIELGYPIPPLAEGESIGTLMHEVLAVPPTRVEELWANTLQFAQDRGELWAFCLRKADAAKKHLGYLVTNIPV